MTNTKAVKIMVPNGQISIIQEWVDQGKFSSVSAFCMTAVEKEIERQKEIEIQYMRSKEANRTNHSTPSEVLDPLNTSE